MRKGIVVGMILVALAIVGGVYLARNTSNETNTTGNISTPVAVTSAPSTAQSPSVAQDGNITASPSLAQTANIIVTSPKANATVTVPFTITGRARVFENQFNYEVRDASGKVLKSGSAYANSPDTGQFGNFAIEITSLAAATSGKITIEVFDYSAKDGSKQDIVLTPVTLKTTQ